MRSSPEHKAALNSRLAEQIDRALKERGTSARAASIAVVGHDGLIRDIRNGNVPTADKVVALCHHLRIPIAAVFGNGSAGDATPDHQFAEPPATFEIQPPGHGDSRPRLNAEPPTDRPFFVFSATAAHSPFPSTWKALADPAENAAEGDYVVAIDGLYIAIGRYYGPTGGGADTFRMSVGASGLIADWSPSLAHRLHPIIWAGRDTSAAPKIVIRNVQIDTDAIFEDIESVLKTMDQIKRRIDE